jgi:hypothetical protein
MAGSAGRSGSDAADRIPSFEQVRLTDNINQG